MNTAAIANLSDQLTKVMQEIEILKKHNWHYIHVSLLVLATTSNADFAQTSSSSPSTSASATSSISQSNTQSATCTAGTSNSLSYNQAAANVNFGNAVSLASTTSDPIPGVDCLPRCK